MKRAFPFFLSLLFFNNIHFAQELPEAIKYAYQSINAYEAYSYCKIIASNEFEGRLTGSEGYAKAATWAAEKFKEWGLIPLSKTDGYLQPYNDPYTQLKSAKMSLSLYSGEKITLELPSDYLPLAFSDKGEYDAQVVFVGWGISAPELGYDDYAGLDVKDKVVLCFRGQPEREDTAFFKHDQHRKRMQTAFDKGALGLLYIYPKVQINPNGDRIEGFMPAEISESVADKILAEKGFNSSSLREKLISEKTTFSFVLNSIVKSSVDADYFPEAIGYNIAGYVEGSDPAMKDECIVVGGHFDHCGEHMGYLFTGANDNASGSAVVMEIAEAFSKLKIKPKRSVMFVLFGSEEKGQNGSYLFVDNFPKQFSKIDGLFNFDMVGEGDGTSYGYSLNDPLFKENLLKADNFVKTFKRSFEIKNIGVRSGDISPFFFAGSPVAAFFSNGPHLHYHETGDTIYRINPDILADISRVGFLSVYFWTER